MSARTGDRKLQILQTLAQMLERPNAEKITTASLASKIGVSEAALYRHFASKAQMYEGLIDFIEQTLFGFINKISSEETGGVKQVEAILSLLLGFASKNPGMTRVLIGEALVHENERLQGRINQLQDRLEATLKQCLRFARSQGEIGEIDEAMEANLLICYVIGRWQQYAKSGFRRDPMEYWTAQWGKLSRF
ncbi:MAG: nucleoid occlusion factor SlmA [Burkholderiales bacterium]|nr:nucleoid occlusion factor SlmA [Burkholderiales bacterium]